MELPAAAAADCPRDDARCAPYYTLTWVLLALFLACVSLIVADWVLFFHTGKSCQERTAPKWMLDHARRRREEHSAAAASSTSSSRHPRYHSPRPRRRSPGARAPGYTPPRHTIRLSTSSKAAPSLGLRRDTLSSYRSLGPNIHYLPQRPPLAIRQIDGSVYVCVVIVAVLISRDLDDDDDDNDDNAGIFQLRHCDLPALE
ncbi:hypothetical protein F5Y12DRAFT_790861 [Xylaria sp. FL1777]|nr:hypothetical protein F5Y12DRAFT_790861 [Xylaria sp. FL1777]